MSDVVLTDAPHRMDSHGDRLGDLAATVSPICKSQVHGALEAVNVDREMMPARMRWSSVEFSLP